MSRRSAAVIGLGSMGSGIAASLMRAGFDVAGYDTNRASLERFREQGGQEATSPADAAAGASVIFSVVINAAQTTDILFGPNGCSGAMSEAAVFISCATVAPADARALSARLAGATRAPYLDAPISGGAQRAAAGELTVLASGPGLAFERARPALDAVAARTFELGDEAGTGSAFKMVNQLLAGIHIAAASEAISFAAKLGLDLRKVYDVITVSAGNSWMFENRIPHVLDGDYKPRSAVDIFVKDLGIVSDMARVEKVAVPMSATALQLFLMTTAAGMGRDDDASVARLYARLMGIDMEVEGATDPDLPQAVATEGLS